MCGRYAITLPPEAFRNLFEYPEQPNFPPRYNVAPTQPVPVVLRDGEARHFRLVRWGFVPAWARDPKEFPLVINARGETLQTKATFRNALKRRRCIFLADGFYEWRRSGREKIPFLIRRRDHGPMPLAGLWETYSDASGGEIDTAAIVTTDANGLLCTIHDRMPVILNADGIATWLNVRDVDADKAMLLVRPSPDDWLETVPIGPRVNSVRNDDPDVQRPSGGPVATAMPDAPRAKAELNPEDEQGRLF